MKTVSTILGLVLGVGAFALWTNWSQYEDESVGPILSDCDGAIRELVIQYETDAQAIALPVYTGFLPQLPASINVHVVCPTEQDFHALISALPQVKCKLKPVITGHPHSTWSRDRWIARTDGRHATLMHARAEEGAEHWAKRAGDQRIAEDLAQFLNNTDHGVSNLFFDGGDFVTDAANAFASSRLLERNRPLGIADPDVLAYELSTLTGRRTILLPHSPNHHAGMYMMPIGHRRMLVGDPSLARAALSPNRLDTKVIDPDWSDSTQASFDAVAEHVASLGYTVHRIPVVPGKDGRTYLSYLNVIIDEREDRRVVYMPVYDGSGGLNEAAAEVWRSHGYQVKPVDCTSAYRHYGSLRCLVNVLQR